MRIPPPKLLAAVEHYRALDPPLHQVIQRVGPCTLSLHRDRFDLLVRSIVSQQISTAAARSIRLKLSTLLEAKDLTAEILAAAPDATLRSAGLSGQKVAYLRDLSEHVLSGQLQLKRLGRCPDEAVIEQLTAVHGIGRWTAQMFLIFGLGRLDVFPEGDLGVRMAIRKLYELPDVPTPRASRELTAHWSPYASIGAWYAWRLVDQKTESAPPATGYPV